MSNATVNKKSGLATAGLILGIIGAALSFIPIINNAAFVIGIFALIFGIIALIKKETKGKTIASIILGIAAISITLLMQQAASNAIDEVSKEIDKITGDNTEEVLNKDVDITLGNFIATTDEYGFTNTKLVVTVKNTTDSKKSYSIHIEAVDADGKRIEDDYVYANDLTAGQTQDFEIFNLVQDEKVDLLKNATFKIVEASAY